MNKELRESLYQVFRNPWQSSDINYFASSIVDDVEKWLEANNLEIVERKAE